MSENPTKSTVFEFWNKNRFGILVLLIISLSFLAYTTIRYVQAFQVVRQWTEFDSQNYMDGENNPDGFRLETPQSWISAAHDGGGQKNLGNLRARFSNPFFVFSRKTYLAIWWRRVDETWTLENVRDWYIEDLGFGINRSALEQRRNSFQEVSVGAGNYPALSQDFWHSANSGTQIVLFVVGDEAFILQFTAQDFDTETSNTFTRMLNSFEVYK